MDKDLKQYKEILKDLVAMKSVAALGHEKDIDKTVMYLKQLFIGLGFKVKIIKGKRTNPYVYAEAKVSKDAETILIYGHYDVQPADIKDGWKKDPFELVEKNGRLSGRGVTDDKGQFLIHVITVANLLKENKLTKNIKFFLEGNEETANTEIGDVIKDNKELLACDYVLISDGEISNENPAADVSFRGGTNMRIVFETAKNDVHSGLFGGAFPNAAMELSTLVSKFYDSKNRINIKGFYEGVISPSTEELKNNKSTKFDLAKLKETTGVKSLKMQKGLDFYTQTGLLPMLTVSGFKSGFIENGFNNIIPCKAEIRINFRFAANQNPDKILKVFKKFVTVNTPKYVKVSFEETDSYPPIKIDTKNSAFKEAKKILEKVYAKKLILRFCGASIPVVVDFTEVLKKPVLSIGLGNEDCNAHGVDENIRINLIKKGLEFSRNLLG